jgi:hypothetical protein
VESAERSLELETYAGPVMEVLPIVDDSNALIVVRASVLHLSLDILSEAWIANTLVPLVPGELQRPEVDPSGTEGVEDTVEARPPASVSVAGEPRWSRV